MTTKSKRRGQSDARAFLEELRGGPLTLGGLLHALRECDEQSLAQFADRLGISRSHLSEIEKGNKGVSPARAARFAASLGHVEQVFVELAIADLLRADGLPYGVKLTAQPLDVENPLTHPAKESQGAKETLEVGQTLRKAAIGADRDLALRGVLGARRLMQLDPSISLLVRLPFNRCPTCGRGRR